MNKPLSVSTALATRLSSMLFALFFVTGFTALLYQVVWQRMLGFFSGSDVRSVTIVVAAYLLGLGVGSAVGGLWGDRLSSQNAVRVYGYCNLGIAAFAICSRFLFYNFLFGQLNALADSLSLLLLIVFISLLLPTALMGASLPLLAKAVSQTAAASAPKLGLLYGINTLGSGLGTLLTGWYIIGTWGYERTLYLGAGLSALVGMAAILAVAQFQNHCSEELSSPVELERQGERQALTVQLPQALWQWCLLLFISGFIAISLEIIWFRILDILLQSVSYTYAHLLAFILVGNALGSLVGTKVVRQIQRPRSVFLQIQAAVTLYALVSVWLLSLYWRTHASDLTQELGYIEPSAIYPKLLIQYGIIPMLMLTIPSCLLGFYFPVVLKAIQTQDHQIGRRVGLIQLANILGNTTGSLLTGLMLLGSLGTVGSLRLLGLLGLGLALLGRMNGLTGLFTVALAAVLVLFPSNANLWAGLHGIPAQQPFVMVEDATGVAIITETAQQATLLASGQAQASLPYMQVHALLGTIPALLHPQPRRVLIIGLGSGGTAHTAGVNALTQQLNVVELLGAELPLLRDYAKTPIGRPLQALFSDPRYRFIVGDGRRELQRAEGQFDIIEADAIYPWRSRAGMLYSQEFFREVQSRLTPDGLFVEWNAGLGVSQTFRSVFPWVTELALAENLYVLIGSEQPIRMDIQSLVNRLQDPAVEQFLMKAQVNIAALRREIAAARIQVFSQSRDGRPEPFNTDLFPRSEYYLNQPLR